MLLTEGKGGVGQMDGSVRLPSCREAFRILPMMDHSLKCGALFELNTGNFILLDSAVFASHLCGSFELPPSHPPRQQQFASVLLNDTLVARPLLCQPPLMQALCFGASRFCHPDLLRHI